LGKPAQASCTLAQVQLSLRPLEVASPSVLKPPYILYLFEPPPLTLLSVGLAKSRNEPGDLGAHFFQP
jgi:hypothetical protein